MTIQVGKKYRIRSSTPGYFYDKYGDFSPHIDIEGEVEELLGEDWLDLATQNFAVMLFLSRINNFKDLKSGVVYGGKIKKPDGLYLSELIHESELEEFDNASDV